ncbi:forkhead box protein N4 jumeau [Haematobia irritans]|uniref:forkhead box protein N4 jumeau n=1 Tax=Haematobia irritans TaxID=7368 RepID=UPI003F4F9DD6
MFELEEYSSGFHDGFLNKYADSSGPTLDFYISDSLQDMLDVDIRSEVANVVGSASDYDTCLGDLPSSFDHGTDALSLINGSNSIGSNKDGNIISSWSSTTTTSTYGLGSSNSSSSWFGANSDFLADVGACVNPISVMPLISSSLLHLSPKTNLNANSLRSSSPPPPSPNVNDTKSHLTFSPAHIKISANSIRNEQLTSHIPKQQIVAISSAVTSATTAPATMATNSALQRKNPAIEAIKKDLGSDLRKVVPVTSAAAASSSMNDGGIVFKTNPIAVTGSSTSNTITTYANGRNSPANQQQIITTTTTTSSSTPPTSSASSSSSSSSSTIKLGPGIGGLTFANNITYNKLKQHTTTTKLNQGSTTITANGAIVLKRDRASSPLQTITTINGSNGQHVTKILSRNGVQTSTSFTPKSIASSAHNAYIQQQQQQQNHQSNTGNSSPSQNSSYTISAGIGVFSSNSNGNMSSASSNSSSSPHSNASSPNLIAVKPLQQKIKLAPVESDFPKPAYSYSCLIAMALKNSRSGSLPVSEIYSFMCEHFPYFKTAPSGWKNSVRHNLSLNKCFEKIEKPPTNGNQRKGCLWAMNPERITKMDEEVQKWSRKDPMAIRNAMVCPEHLEALERGEMKHGSSGDSDVEMDSQSEIEEASDLEEQELDETLVDNMLVEEDIDDELLNAVSIKTEEVQLSDNEDEGGCDIVVNHMGKIQHHRRATLSSPITLSSKGTTLNGGGINSMTENMHRDFDIEVEDIYDAIDIDDDKEAVRMAISQSDIIELSPADYIANSENHQSPKRARLNINYSIGPAGEIEKQIQNQQRQIQNQLQMQNIKKIVKVQNIQDLQHIQQQLQQQQIVVQTISANGGGGGGIQQQTSNGQFTQIIGGSLASNDNQNRRKMQLVNRIA